MDISDQVHDKRQHKLKGTHHIWSSFDALSEGSAGKPQHDIDLPE
jgi:hypothetical protein